MASHLGALAQNIGQPSQREADTRPRGRCWEVQPARTGSAYRSYWMRLYGCVAIERAPCAMAISIAASARRGLYTSRSAFQQALRDASLASWRAAL